MLGSSAVTLLQAATDTAVGVAVNEGGRLIVWGLDAGGTLVQRAEPASSGVNDVTISGDGRVVAAVSADGTARLWTAEGVALPTGRWATSRVGDVALSADGETVLLGTTDGTALIGSTDAATPLRTLGDFGVWPAQLSSDGTTTLTLGDHESLTMRRVGDESLSALVRYRTLTTGGISETASCLHYVLNLADR